MSNLSAVATRNVKAQLAVAALICGNFLVNILEKWIDPTGEKHKDVTWIDFGGKMSKTLQINPNYHLIIFDMGCLRLSCQLKRGHSISVRGVTISAAAKPAKLRPGLARNGFVLQSHFLDGNLADGNHSRGAAGSTIDWWLNSTYPRFLRIFEQAEAAITLISGRCHELWPHGPSGWATAHLAILWLLEMFQHV